MTLPIVRRASTSQVSPRPLRRGAMRLLVPALALLAATAAGAQTTATFTLVDKTHLTPGSYQIYVTGFSTAGPQGPLILQQDGSWANPPAPVAPATTITGTLPCYRFSPGVTPAPADAITQIQIDSAQTSISARVYYFVVTDTTLFPNCNPTAGNTGLFNVPSAFTYTYTYPATFPAQPNPQPSIALSEPSTTFVSGMTFPAWTYSEIGASSTNGTIDLSQVDFYAFPMSTTATVLAGNPSGIGNPVGSAANPGDAVNHMSIRDSYRRYIDAQAVAAGQPCDGATPAPVCAYLDLLQDVTTPNSTAPQYVIQNPGGYLAQYTPTTIASTLNNVFGSVTPVAGSPGSYTVDGVIGQLWSTTVPPTTAITVPPTAIPGTGTIVLDSGGLLGGTGGVPQDRFTGTVVAINYPGVTPAYPVNALMFKGTAASGNYVAYVVSPADYQVGCATLVIPNCVNAASTGYQVFAGAGAFNTPAAATYTALLNAGLLSATAAGYNAGTGYDAVVARLGFLISGAMNRGVALVPCTGQDVWKCWQDETYWYPTTVSSTFPDITQNQFSRWMHTATIGGTPMFLQPPGALNSAGSTAGAGKPQGMAYGFSNDENPTPAVPSPPATVSPQPEVPSKLDGTVVYGPASTSYTITFGPWVTAPASNPTLTVATAGSGAVTSTPAGIDCGSTCSQAYQAGTVVTLTAQPGAGWLFAQWTGACAGSSTTCTLTIDSTTSVTAEFGVPLAAPPALHSLHVVVGGSGAVGSAPAGISCGTACSKSFAANATVTLTAAASAGSTFAGWSGACAGTSPTCAVTMSAARTVGAAFVAAGAMKLSVAGGAGGVVTTAPGAIDCGVRCIAGFAPGTQVSVVATAKHGYRFAGWGGACSGSGTCDLTLNGDTSVQASFAPIAPGQFALTVHDFGEGTITSAPGGISCGTACSAAFAAGTKVTLVATPAPGHQFAGWSGVCRGTGPCVVWMEDFANAYAFFAPVPAPVAVEPIPTLSEWALALLALLVASLGGAGARLRARTAR